MGDAGDGDPRAIEWTAHESMLWETARIVGAVLRGETLAGRPTNFALSLSNDYSEVVLASGTYERNWLGAIGDGTYRTNTTFVGGFSPMGIVLGGATLGGSALGNARRKSRAAADASIAWRPIDGGVVHVSNYGIYLDTSGQLLSFGYHSIQRMDLLGPGTAQWSATMASGGAETFQLSSVCVELVFALWALARCPAHPQLVNFTWLPETFMARVRYAGLDGQLGGGSLPMLTAR
jgi:hypothetical protein